MDGDFFNLGNKALCINFNRGIMRRINSCGKSIRKVHVFVFCPICVDTEKLGIFSRICREGGIKCIVHCYSVLDRKILREEMKGTMKDKFFHFNLLHHGKFTFSCSDSKKLSVSYRHVEIRTELSDGYAIMEDARYSYESCTEIVNTARWKAMS